MCIYKSIKNTLNVKTQGNDKFPLGEKFILLNRKKSTNLNNPFQIGFLVARGLFLSIWNSHLFKANEAQILTL